MHPNLSRHSLLRDLPSFRLGATLVSLSLPWLLTYSVPPSSTFVSQLVAWAAWGLLVLLLVSGERDRRLAGFADLAWAISPLLVIFVVLLSAVAVAPFSVGLPASLAWSAAATIAGAALVLLAGAAMAKGGRLTDAMLSLFVPLVIAAALSSLIAVIQIFFSDWAGNMLIGVPSFAERASGNLRQPNHLSSLAVWAMVGVVWLSDANLLRRSWSVVLCLMLVTTVVLTGSRTGLLGILILAVWAFVDRDLSRFNRRLLWLMPLVYAVGWWLFRQWATQALGTAAVVDRIGAGGDISSARFAIWTNTLELIQQHPLAGVGFGEFNFAWSLTPFPGRPTQFYDHTHNLVLQWLVELGIPLALLLCGALTIALWRCFRAADCCDAADRPAYRAAFVLILLIVLHSLLEYPLWYSYFLLPTVFAFGICLSASRVGRQTSTGQARPADLRSANAFGGLRISAVLMLAVTAFAGYDYHKLAVIFAPGPAAAPLAQRIEAGKRSLFFAHHADYAAATIAADPSKVIKSFDSASHMLLDTRLMLAWAKAYAGLGDEQRARHIADRLREFDNSASKDFFAVCDELRSEGVARPFQCQASAAQLDYQNFR